MSQANVTTKLNNLTDILVTNTAPSFVVGGIVTTDVMGNYSRDMGSSVTVQTDSKILLGGTSSTITGFSSANNFALVRYNSDGSLDLSFDGDGIVTTAGGYGYRGYGYSGGYGSSVTVQTDGKILLSGGSNNDFALMRYNSDGSLDISFDGDGTVTTDLLDGSGRSYASSVTVQTDGKILLGGTSLTGVGMNMSPVNNFALVRYNPDGSLDLSFNDDGIVTTDLGSGFEDGASVTVQADGKILLGGASGNGFTLVRYNTDGSLDLSFDGDGIVTTAGGYGSSVTVQADGKILLVGSSNEGFTLVRYNADGSLDLNFDSDGIVTTSLGSDYAYDYINGSSVTVQDDGKILVGGGGGSGNSDFALVRYNPDGSLDLSFDGDGKVTTNLGGYDHGPSVTVQADDKILLGGFSNWDFALVRYNSDGSLDNSFNPNPANTPNNKPSYTENGKAIVLDYTVLIYDAELAAQGNYNGASITLARQGGANAEDVFSGRGLLRFSGSDAVLSGVSIGTVSNSNGTLTINFNSDATQTRVDTLLSSIAYRNTTDYPPVPTDTPASVQIDWTFNDGNTGTQGIGNALTTTGSSIITILAKHAYNEFIGTTGNDALIGRSGANKIYGFAGNDSLDGGRGADSMLGGLGDDLYTVDRGNDVVIENSNEGIDTINSNASYYHLSTNVENLTLIGSRSINGKGNDLANTLIGNDQDNHLSGGAGADRLSGGLGADLFIFNTEAETGITATTRDIIIDFSHDQGDKIKLSAIDADTALKGNNAFAALTVGGTFSGVFANPGELYFDQTTHILYGNNDADSTADFSIKVMGVNSLVAADFLL